MALVQLQGAPDDRLQRQQIAIQLMSQALGNFAQHSEADKQRRAVAGLLMGTPAASGPGLGALTAEHAPGLRPDLAGPALALRENAMAAPAQAGLLQGGDLGQLAPGFIEAGGDPSVLAGLMPEPERPFTLGEGEVRYDAQGRQVAAGPPKAEKPLSVLGKIASDLGLDLDSPDGFARAVQVMKETQPSTKVENIMPGAPAQEFIEIKGEPFRIIRDASGAPVSVEPMAGTATALERETAATQAAGRQERQVTTADIVSQDVARALDLSESAFTTGVAGQLSSSIGGTPAKDLAALLDTVRANVGFAQLQQMRADSPTGGALGAISERENVLLQSVLGSLEQSQSKEQFQFNLKRLFNVTNDIVHGPGAGPPRYDLPAPTSGAAPQAGSGGFSAMSPAEFGRVDTGSLSEPELDAYLEEAQRRGFR